MTPKVGSGIRGCRDDDIFLSLTKLLCPIMTSDDYAGSFGGYRCDTKFFHITWFAKQVKTPQHIVKHYDRK